MVAKAQGSEETALLTPLDLDYDLPKNRIAQVPSVKRDGARMLIVERTRRALRNAVISDLPALLEKGDLLVANDAKVLPARIHLRRPMGGQTEGLFLEEMRMGTWRVLLKGSRRLRAGEALQPSGQSNASPLFTLQETLGSGQWVVRVTPPEPADQVLSRIGRPPLPPYIKRHAPGDAADARDQERYQTVYARKPGAVAAPTAGMHLTKELLQTITNQGMEVAFVTLYVGPGTFKPMSAASFDQHRMHPERYELSAETVDAIRRCRARGGRIVAVGTTTVRVLETAARPSDMESLSGLTPRSGTTDLFIYPPFEFRVVDALLTNFHLPRSTLLALVMAFAGVELTRQAYDHAIKHAYRFYSYGDAMLVM